MRLRSSAIAVATLSVLLAACGASQTTSTTDSPTASQSQTYMSSGPFDIGVTTLTLDRGPMVEVWYPTSQGTTATDTYDVRDFTPEAIRGLLTGDAPATFSIDATRDAPVANETHPVVLFSHGSSGMRVQSSFLTSHLASWGMIVIAPDHWSRDLPRALLGQTVGSASDTPADLFDALTIVNESQQFAQSLDLNNIAIVGHSAGGGTALLAASDERIKGYVSMASGNLSSQSQMPNKPSFFIAGALDQIVTVADRTRPAFESAPSPSLLWVIDEVGHNGFDDFCTFGNGTGIIGVADASGLGALLDSNPALRRLGEDGCLPPSAPVEQAFPIIRHAVTAWLRHLFEVDQTQIGLEPDTQAQLEAYELAISVIESK